MTRKLGITPDRPYFEHDGLKYFYMFDVEEHTKQLVEIHISV
jgi:hypothetical protein